MNMENKLNIAELLKDCPCGMELDCALFENIEFDHINKDNGPYPIICRVKTEWGNYNVHTFTEYGCYSTEKYSKCIIFPKGKTTWEGFHRPFKDGDVITCTNSICSFVAIFKKIQTDTTFIRYVSLTLNNEPQFKVEEGWADFKKPRFATEEEKQKLFDAIKANGYCWNAETKTLEKLPKFKVGDKIKLKGGDEFGNITQVTDCFYRINWKNTTHCWPIKKQDDWELVLNKFDITALKPFDKVLVRDGNNVWHIHFFEKYDKSLKYPFVCMNRNCYKQCIPYENNEHLLGTTNDCDDFYKTWD